MLHTPLTRIIFTILLFLSPILKAEIAPDLPPESPCHASFTTQPDTTLTLADFGLVENPAQPIQLINIWALWCAPCRSELPVLDKLAAAYPDIIHPLNLGDAAQAITHYAAQQQLQLDLSHRAVEDILQRIGAQGLPYNALFYQGKLIGIRNQAIHDEQTILACLDSLTAIAPSID